MVEADESDRSLLKLSPEIAVLTNAELDHHSTYSSRLDLEQTLREFMGRAGDRRGRLGPTRAAGAVPARRARLRRPRHRDAHPRGSRFHWRGIEVSLAVPGAHNAVNAAGALTAAALAGADPARAAAALASFRGARRRFELLGTTDAGVPVYDDYAHHPTEVAATIAAARTLAPARLVAVFQPHLYSRTRALAREFGAALAAADLVGGARRLPGARAGRGLPGRRRAPDRARPRPMPRRAGRWRGCRLRRRPRGSWRRRSGAGDLCLVMGAGDIDSLGRGRWWHRAAAAAGCRSSIYAGSRWPERPPGVQRDYPLARLTTIRTGGPAELFARPGSLAELERLLAWAAGRAARGRGRGLGVEPAGCGRRRPRAGPQAGQGAEHDRTRRNARSAAAAARACPPCRRGPRRPG